MIRSDALQQELQAWDNDVRREAARLINEGVMPTKAIIAAQRNVSEQRR